MTAQAAIRNPDRLRWTSAPYFLMHLACIFVFFVPFSWDCVAICVGMYYLRMFGITAGYHRYFAHRGYKTSRVFQFVLAWIGAMSSQRGVLWWAGHHRHHHKFSDMDEDVHSPKRGFWWSHMIWFLVPRFDFTPKELIRDFHKFPELVFINKHWYLPPTFLGVVMFLIGGAPWLVWGFVLSTTLLWHGTFTINSLSHVWGRRRYETTDASRNNLFLSLLTMGEGWHNNHHFYHSTANNGFFWWEIDMSYYILRGLSWCGIVWELRTPPAWVLEGKRRASDAHPVALEMPAYVARAVERATKICTQWAHAKASAAHARDQVALRAAKAAESASEAARRAADAAAESATTLRAVRARWALKCAEASHAAATAAAEASQSASEMAASLKTTVAEAAARKAAVAAEAAKNAAAAANAALAKITPLPSKAG